MIAALALALALAVPSPVAPRVTEVASMLTGRPGTQVVPDVSAQPEDWGYADIPGNIIHLRPDLAALLNDVTVGQPFQVARAVLLYCHEARHVRGTRSERIAELWALHHVYVVSRLLGAPPARARAINRWAPYWDAFLRGLPIPPVKKT